MIDTVELRGVPTRGQELLRVSVPAVPPYEPAGAGSKTAEPLGKRFKEVRDREGRIVLKYRPASKYTKPWMEKVSDYVVAAWKAGRVGGALYLDAYFFEERPGNHYRSGKFAHLLKPDAPAYPEQTKAPDVDKMRRAVGDSLTEAKLIVDDKRLVGGEHWKFYAPERTGGARALIVVGRMAHQRVEELPTVESPAPAGQGVLL